MGEFQSERGLVINPAHQYELRAEYNNTSSASVDAMAILYLYLLENDFHYPAGKGIQVQHAPASEHVDQIPHAARPG